MDKVIRWFDWDRIYNWLAGAVGAIVGLAGGWDAQMQVLAVLMVADYVSGVICAIKERTLSSQVGFVGILRKLMIFGVVVTAAQVDAMLGQEAVCRTAAVLFYAANEAVSLLENAGRMGLPVPEKLLEKLAQLKGDSGKGKSD